MMVAGGDDFASRADELRARVRQLHSDTKKVKEMRLQSAARSDVTEHQGQLLDPLPDHVVENASRRRVYSDIGLLMLEIEEKIEADGGGVAAETPISGTTTGMRSRQPSDAEKATHSTPAPSAPHFLVPLLRDLSLLADELPLVYARASPCPPPLALTLTRGSASASDASGNGGGVRLPLDRVWPYLLGLDAVARFVGVLLCMAALAVTVAPLVLLLQVSQRTPRVPASPNLLLCLAPTSFYVRWVPLTSAAAAEHVSRAAGQCRGPPPRRRPRRPPQRPRRCRPSPRHRAVLLPTHRPPRR